MLQYGNFKTNTKDVDSKKGIVSFYFCDFNSVDLNGRRFLKNSFNRTINNNTKKIKHLFNHNFKDVVGIPKEIGTDSRGVFMVSQLRNTELGRDVLDMYENQIITEHSFGFYIEKSSMDKDVEIVEEVKMLEASSLTMPAANPDTPMISLNSYYEEITQKIIEKLNKLEALFLAEQARELAVKQEDKKENYDSLVYLLRNIKF